MKPRMRELLDTMQKYNSTAMCREVFGLDSSVEYDALVVAPGWKPTRIIRDPSWHVTLLADRSYVSGYEAEKDGLRIAWIQCASGACNLIDHLTICAELEFRKLIFVGAVGSLTPEIDVGELCTSACSVEGSFAGAYLNSTLTGWQPFAEVTPPDAAFQERVKALAAQRGRELRAEKVFCTDSISMEYSHLDEIRATGARLIEMETAAFYRLADLMEVPAAALLVVSDNSASGVPLVGRNEEQDRRYHEARSVIIPDMIAAIARMD